MGEELIVRAQEEVEEEIELEYQVSDVEQKKRLHILLLKHQLQLGWLLISAAYTNTILFLFYFIG